MKLTSKTYKTNKTKNIIKTTSLLFIYNGISRKAANWITTEQELKNINFKYYNIFNKITSKTLNSSILKNFKFLIHGITFFIKPYLKTIKIKKQILLNTFDSLLFKLLALKLNNKIYSANQLNKIYSISYKKNKMLLYQFGVTNLKIDLHKKL